MRVGAAEVVGEQFGQQVAAQPVVGDQRPDPGQGERAQRPPVLDQRIGRDPGRPG
ncbi:hypothetical protein ACQPW3_16130 [Actinosynnema sp. CA-248983]